MFTTRTTILSLDPDEARAEFNHWVHHEPVVILVLLGTGPQVEATVGDADKLANKLSNLAHVLWARDPDALTRQFAALDASPALRKQMPGQGFALSLTDRVVDVIRKSEDPPDMTRLLELFNNALDDAGLGE
jgi:hypothetical protein